MFGAIQLLTCGGIRCFWVWCSVFGWVVRDVSKESTFLFSGLQVRASSYIEMNQPTRCSNFSGLLLVV